MIASRILVVAALLGLVLALPLVESSARADGKAIRPDVMSVGDIKPGMKGYGLTVFEGVAPERFDVEVIDVLRNFQPHQDLILVKTKHPRLDVAKVVAGMSGSPIFINGKMIGAYAYGWSFGEEPVAGVTPIRNMLDELDRPLPKDLDGWPFALNPGAPKREAAERHTLNEPGSSNRFAGRPEEYSLTKHVEQLARQQRRGLPPDTGMLRPVSTPLLVGGMGSGAIDVATDLLSPLGLLPLQAGGGGANDPNAPNHYVDGGAIGVQLIRGDMTATGLGTVTRVEGDRLLGFGHPMMNSGVTNLPTAIGKVLWFLASSQRSFKIGMPVRDLGALVGDRQSAIVVSESVRPPVVPVSVHIKGVPGASYTDWNFEVAHEKFMTPTFLAIALGSALDATASEHQDVSWNAVSKLKIKGFGELEIEDYGVAVGGTPGSRDFVRSNLVGTVGALLNNPWQPLIVESVHMDIEFRYARELLRLRGAQVLDREVYAGRDARIQLTFVPFAGPEVNQVISLPIPKHFAGQTLKVEIRPGYTVARSRATPDSLAELIENFKDPTYPPKSVVLSYSTGDAVAFKGRVAENLPPSAMDALRPTSASVAPEPYNAQENQVTPLKEFMVGGDTVSFDVKPVLN